MPREVSENAYHGLAPGLVPRTHDKDQYIDHKYLDRKYDMKGNLVQTSFSLFLEFFWFWSHVERSQIWAISVQACRLTVWA